MRGDGLLPRSRGPLSCCTIFRPSPTTQLVYPDRASTQGAALSWRPPVHLNHHPRRTVREDQRTFGGAGPPRPPTRLLHVLVDSGARLGQDLGPNSMGVVVTSTPKPFEVHKSGALLHGTKADLSVGELLVPGHRSNYGRGRLSNRVYVTRTLDAAVWGAELAIGEGRGRIYIVEPEGTLHRLKMTSGRRDRWSAGDFQPTPNRDGLLPSSRE